MSFHACKKSTDRNAINHCIKSQRANGRPVSVAGVVIPTGGAAAASQPWLIDGYNTDVNAYEEKFVCVRGGKKSVAAVPHTYTFIYRSPPQHMICMMHQRVLYMCDDYASGTTIQHMYAYKANYSIYVNVRIFMIYLYIRVHVSLESFD